MIELPPRPRSIPRPPDGASDSQEQPSARDNKETGLSSPEPTTDDPQDKDSNGSSPGE
ncbi:hypothetical protein XM38_004680 [Halomicronema hongdechloris C2206]|uniref:Uncharacterized protein n=1 Tax=Halomicronema hongdechloris C2206 TaxID=1641165 RepID=A0A1Z3HGY0_9CYAN|nr:hypothetical protein XM38_004680 [Halomicronema hongdechloris C2206]